MLLTKVEVSDLTGYARPATQSRWLRENSIPFILGGDGHPKVLRQVIETRLGGQCEPHRKPELRLK
jgi:hypothetical protein